MYKHISLLLLHLLFYRSFYVTFVITPYDFSSHLIVCIDIFVNSEKRMSQPPVELEMCPIKV